MTERDEHLRCGDCECDIECCEMCDSEECAKAICYGCLVVAVGQSIPHPHPHGG